MIMMKPGMLAVLTIFCLGLAGCIGKSPQVTFYHLSPIETLSSRVQAPEAEASLSLGVGPIRFPEVLDRPQIVTRTDSNSYLITEFQRWGGSLPNEFSRVFAENLSLLLKTEKVAVFPWEKHFQPRYRVLLDIQRFDGRLGEFALLESRWTITDSEGRQTLKVGKSSIETPVADARYEAHVKGLDQALKALSEEIAAEIKKLEKTPE
jgi:uncharacterized lipoprotein YmbA